MERLRRGQVSRRKAAQELGIGNATLKRLLEMELESLVVPGANAAEEAGKLLINLPKLWEQANPEEQRRLLLTMLDAVYVDTKKTKSILR